ncbi:hypothetical protein KQR56_05725 [Bacillus velezensis]|nr:hypothetical protein [Bacillus velezensis]
MDLTDKNVPAIFQPVNLFVVKAIFFCCPSNMYSNDPLDLENTSSVHSPEPSVPAFIVGCAMYFYLPL